MNLDPKHAMKFSKFESDPWPPVTLRLPTILHLTIKASCEWLFTLCCTVAPQPVDADGKTIGMHIFDVPEGSQEYQDVLRRFHESASDHWRGCKTQACTRSTSLCKIPFVTNTQRRRWMWLVRQLFHGSKEDRVKLIAADGFNRSLAADSNGGYSAIVYT